jgi:UV DNA damage endonuclease
MEYDWQNHFKAKFKAIGNYIKKNDIRITMHPGQYTVLNSPRDRVYQNSLKELNYHTDIIDLLELDKSAKIITHVGGVYNDKQNSIKRFIKRYDSLEERIKNYYVIENDDKSYHVTDCLEISEQTGIPLIFDFYHHECHNTSERAQDVIGEVFQTWKSGDGLPIIHYSSANLLKGKCSHADTIDLLHFKTFIASTLNFDFDLMLEIKDKEISALKALNAILNDERLIHLKL